MNSLTLRIKLESDVVLTERNATVGGPASLDYIPGAALLGVAAESSYGGLAPKEAFEIFHSGAVRFGNGAPESPVTPGTAALTVPLAFHTKKDLVGKSRDVVNLCRQDREPNVQYKQSRAGWMAAITMNSAQMLVCRLNRSMRTSVDEHGQAREGLLFGLQSLAAGQAFIARIDAEDMARLRSVEGALVGRRRLGRSKTAEFGEVTIETLTIGENLDVDVPVVTPRTALAFLCVSDVALSSRAGAARLLPAPDDVGLPEDWTLNLSRSFLRTRRYSPFNSHRKRSDLDRQVIVAGSVLFFVPGKVEASASRVSETLQLGVGSFRQDGLGRLVCDPDILQPERLTLEEPERGSQVLKAATCPKPDDPLADWIELQAAETSRREQAWRDVDLEAVRFQRSGMRKAQWGWLRALAQTAQSKVGSGQRLRTQFEERTRPAPTLKERKALEVEKLPIKDGGGRALRWTQARKSMLAWMEKQPPDELARRAEMLAGRVVHLMEKSHE